MNRNNIEVQNTKVIKFITEDKYRLLRHVVLLLFILGILSFSRDVTEYRGSFRYFKVVVIYVLLMFMCYFNMNILVPAFFFKGKYLTYLGQLILLIIISLSAMFYVLEWLFPDGRIVGKDLVNVPTERGFYEGIIILIPIILVTTMIKLFQRWMRDNQKISELNELTFKMELNELKNQINPHFLFNMLNGIKSLVRTDPNKATMVIMKLSEFLRYQLYENNEEKTLLQSEINFLSNFLALETLRRDNLTATIKSQPDSAILKHIFLPSNLFTVFVENAVKHSVDISGAESTVRVNIKVGDQHLQFNCYNSKDPEYIPASSEKSSGLGQANIKRRLDLLYGTKHTLYINSSKSEYEVTLTIPI